MARLEHINLVVKDIQPTLDFLKLAFPQWRVRGEGDMMWGATPRRWLHFGDDDYYITLNDSAAGNMRDVRGINPGMAHMGFVVEDLEALIQRLSKAGYAIDIIGRDHPYRSTVYYLDLAGFQFEFLQYHSDKPDEKNLYGGERGELQRSSQIN